MYYSFKKDIIFGHNVHITGSLAAGVPNDNLMNKT